MIIISLCDTVWLIIHLYSYITVLKIFIDLTRNIARGVTQKRLFSS